MNFTLIDVAEDLLTEMPWLRLDEFAFFEDSTTRPALRIEYSHDKRPLGGTHLYFSGSESLSEVRSIVKQELKKLAYSRSLKSDAYVLSFMDQFR